MMFAIATVCLAVAVALSGSGRLAGAIDNRFARLIPARAAIIDDLGTDRGYIRLLRRALSLIDPSFARTEEGLRALGMSRSSWIIAIEMAKLAGAAAAGILVAVYADDVIGNTMAMAASPLAVLLFIMLVNRLTKSAALKRRRRIRRELALGIEMLCIFLEGGQSLDQAFRSFLDVCGDALPHIAPIQRALIADLNKGVPYERAIGNWVENLHVDEAKPLATLFVDSLVHGTELVPHLRQFSLELIEQRIANARTSIGVKSSQLTVVMVAFFLPAILAFITAPAITGVLLALERSR